MSQSKMGWKNPKLSYAISWLIWLIKIKLEFILLVCNRNDLLDYDTPILIIIRRRCTNTIAVGPMEHLGKVDAKSNLRPFIVPFDAKFLEAMEPMLIHWNCVENFLFNRSMIN
jgi:hypothetical protein